jgi:hypothetical protein
MNRFAIDGPRLPSFPRSIIHPLGPLFPHLPLRLRRHLLHLRAHGAWGNFDQPRTWSEKMQWRILNDRRVFLGVACDKLASKEYARREAAAAGLQLRIPETYWVGHTKQSFALVQPLLPARWVLKPNHSSSRFRILDSMKEPIDWEDIHHAIVRWSARDEEEISYGHYGYSIARHLVFAEERIGRDEQPPATLRASVARGEIVGCSYSFGTIHPDNPTPRKGFRYNAQLRRVHEDVVGIPASANETTLIDRMSLEERANLINIIKALAGNLDYIRVDLYVEEEIWFGELTMYSGGGLMRLPISRMEDIARSWTLPNRLQPDSREAEWLELLAERPTGTLQHDLQQIATY